MILPTDSEIGLTPIAIQALLRAATMVVLSTPGWLAQYSITKLSTKGWTMFFLLWIEVLSPEAKADSLPPTILVYVSRDK